jgi:hypothetical protein
MKNRKSKDAAPQLLQIIINNAFLHLTDKINLKFVLYSVSCSTEKQRQFA